MNFKNVKAIFAREFKSYFDSPVAYVFLVAFLVLIGFLTFGVAMFYERRQAVLTPFFLWHPWVYLLLVPAATMGLWAEERRNGTIELLLTLPITLGEALIGKFLAAWSFIGIALALTLPVPLIVSVRVEASKAHVASSPHVPDEAPSGREGSSSAGSPTPLAVPARSRPSRAASTESPLSLDELSWADARS